MPALQRRCFLAGLLIVLPGVLTLLPALLAQTGEPRLRANKDGPQGCVILLNNCDASNAPAGAGPLARQPDNQDSVINGDEDKKQLEPIVIPRCKTPGPVALKLVNYHAADKGEAVKKVRLFNARGEAIIGPRTKDRPGAAISDTYVLSPEELKQLAEQDLTMYAEGLQFAVTARLQLLVENAKVDEVVLHVAPFLLVPHTQDPKLNMVVLTDYTPEQYQKSPPGEKNYLFNRKKNSQRYVDDFTKACAQARQASPRAAGLCPQIIHVLPFWVNNRWEGHDVWIEDEMQWGYTETPRVRMPVVLHMYRFQSLAPYVRKLLGRNVGYFQAFDYALPQPPLNPDRTPSFGGNLEVTPPTAKHPFGRVYYGSTFSQEPYDLPRSMHPGFQEFFKRQKRHPSDATALQEPIELSTSWLDVGHVDEMVSFVPAKNKRGYVLLYASPELALDLLKALPFKTQQDADYLDLDGYRYLGDFNFENVRDLLEGKKFPAFRGSFMGMDVESYNLKVAQKIQANVAILRKELGLSDDEIKPIPTLFYHRPRRSDASAWSAVAMTPGMVNLSSMGTFSLVPDPFIPAFRASIRETFKAIGQLPPRFIDDWILYHMACGEVHCGSNMRREPFARKWWK